MELNLMFFNVPLNPSNCNKPCSNMLCGFDWLIQHLIAKGKCKAQGVMTVQW